MSIHKISAVDGLEPRDWPQEHVADVGGDEPFIWNIMELSPVIDATTFSREDKEKVKHAVVVTVCYGGPRSCGR